MNLIVDASVAAKWILDESGSGEARALLKESLYAPDLVLIEVFNAVHKRVKRGEATEDMLSATIPFLAMAFDRTIEVALLQHEASLIAIRHAHPIYDCLYVAAARAAQCSLVSADADLCDVAEQAGVKVRRIG